MPTTIPARAGDTITIQTMGYPFEITHTLATDPTFEDGAWIADLDDGEVAQLEADEHGVAEWYWYPDRTFNI